MKQKIDLKWKTIRHQLEYVNFSQNIDSREKFAFNIIEDLRGGKIIINLEYQSSGAQEVIRSAGRGEAVFQGRLFKRTL
jgi:hypothetical protein